MKGWGTYEISERETIFFELCERENVQGQLMRTKGGRPGVLILNLKYKNQKRDFVVPLRSNISGKVDEWEIKKRENPVVLPRPQTLQISVT